MSNCSCSANSQLKALHARLDRVDDDLIAHYAGISQLVTNLATNPLVSANVALSLTSYNFSSIGQTLLKSLLHLIPGYDTFRQLQHLDAAALVDGLGAKLASAASGIVDAAAAQVTAMAEQVADAATAHVAALAAQAEAVAEGLVGDALAPYDAAVAEAEGILDLANTALGSANSAVNAVGDFIQTLTDIANCKTRSAIIDNT